MTALAIGVPYDTFWHLTPVKLQSFVKADELKKKREDEKLWLQGLYNYNAFGTVIQQALGNKNSKYLDKPILQTYEEENKPLTEEEIQRRREAFIERMKVMKANFDANNSD